LCGTDASTRVEGRPEFHAGNDASTRVEGSAQVFTCDGHAFERVCIEQWFATGSRTSPSTNEVLASTTLIPAHSLRRLIQNFLERKRRENRE